MRTLARLSLLAVLATACSSSTTTPAVQGRASIAGKATFNNDPDASGLLVRLSGPTSGVTQTAADGSYSFAQLLAGSYLIEASSADAVGPAKVTTLLLKEADAATAADLVLTGTGGASGKLFTALGAAAEGATVVVPGTSAVGSVSRNGTFALSGIPAGPADLLFSLAGKGEARAVGVAIKRGKVTELADLTLTAGVSGTSSISGKVLIAGLTSLGGYGVSLQGPTSGGQVTAADGGYAFTGLADGQYVVTAVVRSTLQVAVTRSVEVLGGQAKTGQDLPFSPTGTVSGTATFGTPSGNAGIAVTTLGTLAVTFTDEEGRYTLYGVPSFDQDVVASYPGRTPATAAVVVPFDDTVTADPLVLAAPAGPTGRISGTATLTGLSSHAGVEVLLLGAQGGRQVTAATGAFSFTGLADGTYLLEANGPSTREGSLHLTVTVAGGAPQLDQDFAFTPVGSIEGLALVGGQPAPGVLVYAIGGDRTTLSDELGHWVLPGLSANTNAQVQGTTAGALSQIETPPAVQYAQTVASAALVLQPRSTQDLLESTVAFVDPAAGRKVFVRAQQLSGGLTAETSADVRPGTAGGYSLSVADGLWSLSFQSDDQEWHDTIPTTAALPGGKGFVWDREVFPLAPYTLQYGTRAVSTPKIGGFAWPCSGAAAVPTPKGLVAGGAPAPSAAASRIGKNARNGNLLYLADYECQATAAGMTGLLPSCKGKLHFASHGKDVLLHDGPIWEGSYWLGPDDSAFFAYGPTLQQMQLYVAKVGSKPTLLTERFGFSSMSAGRYVCGSTSSQGATIASFYSDLAINPDTGQESGKLFTVDVNAPDKATPIATDADSTGAPVVTADGKNIWYTQVLPKLNPVVNAASIDECRRNPGKCATPIPDVALNQVTFSRDGQAVLYPQLKTAIPILAQADGRSPTALGSTSWEVLPALGGDLVVTFPEGVKALVQAFAAGSQPRTLGEGKSLYVSLTPDLKDLVVQAQSGETEWDLWASPATAAGGEPIVALARFADQWTVQDDRAAIVVNGAQAGGGDLVLVSLTTGEAATVEVGGMTSLSGPLFASPGHVVYTKTTPAPPIDGGVPGFEVRIAPLVPAPDVDPVTLPTTLVSSGQATQAVFSLDDAQVAVSVLDAVGLGLLIGVGSPDATAAAPTATSVWLGRTGGGAVATLAIPGTDGGYAYGFLADHTLIGTRSPAGFPVLGAFRLGAAGDLWQLDLSRLLTKAGFLISPDGAGAFYPTAGDDGDPMYGSLALFRSGDDAGAVVVKRFDVNTAQLSPDQRTLLVRGEMDFHWPAAKLSTSGSLFLLRADGKQLKILDFADENFAFYGDRDVLGASTARPQPYGWLQSGPYLSAPPWMPPVAVP